MISEIRRALPLLLLASLVSIALLNGAIGQDYKILDATRDLGDLETFSAAIQQADLIGTLNDEELLQLGDNTFVVFAPNDQAFSELPAGMLDALYKNDDNLEDLLEYHIINNDDNRYADLTRFTTAETREGDYLNIRNDDGLTINGARVLESRAYDQGVIHVIDRVLIPSRVANQLAEDMDDEDATLISSNGLLQVLTTDGDLDNFAVAVQTADLVGWLSGEGTLGTSSGPFVIFAPVDDAFEALPDRVLDNLMTRNESDLSMLLRYHIIEDIDVINTTGPTMMETDEGGSLNVDIEGGTVSGARILRSLRYDTGIIYPIDRVLLPVDEDFLDKYGLVLTTPV